MADDPKTYRDEAWSLARLAGMTHSPDLKAVLMERAKRALQRAIQLEQQLLWSLAAIDRAVVHRALFAHLQLELDDANRLLERGETIVAGWRDLIGAREAEGRDVTRHREMLVTFGSHLELHRANRRLLMQMIEQARE